MKNIILALTLTTFAAGAFAGESCCAKDKAASATKDQPTCAAKTTAACCKGEGKCAAGGETAKTEGKKIQSPKDTNKS